MKAKAKVREKIYKDWVKIAQCKINRLFQEEETYDNLEEYEEEIKEIIEEEQYKIEQNRKEIAENLAYLKEKCSKKNWDYDDLGEAFLCSEDIAKILYVDNPLGYKWVKASKKSFSDALSKTALKLKIPENTM